MEFIRQSILILSQLLIFLLFLRVVFSWIAPRSRGGIVGFVHKASDPILKPIRRVMPALGPLDLSPIVAFFLIELIRNLLLRLL